MAQWCHMSQAILVNIGSGNGLSYLLYQAINWTNADLLPIKYLGTYLNEILLKIQTLLSKEMQMKMLSAKHQPFNQGFGILIPNR